MLVTLAIALVVLWVAGLVTANTLGGLIHGLLLIAVVVLLWQVVRGRRSGSPQQEDMQ